ncbi:hypothetical protein BST61_g5845 [Cercospora zeina]
MLRGHPPVQARRAAGWRQQCISHIEPKRNTGSSRPVGSHDRDGRLRVSTSTPHTLFTIKQSDPAGR